MPFSVYEIVVPVMIHGLDVMDEYLDHAQNWESANHLDSGDVLRVRLAPDMLTFGEQVSVACNKVEAHLARLRQLTAPELPTVTLSYLGLKERLKLVRAGLEKLGATDLETAQSHTFELKAPVARGWYGGTDYIRHLILPDFFFHIAISHAILRHLGLSIGKRDYLGHLTPESGGYG